MLVSEGYGPRGMSPLEAETVVSGLEVPWGIAFLPGGDWLVTERPGRVRLVRDGKLLSTVLTIPVAPGAEGGLLGIAASPSFTLDRLFYVYTTVSVGGARTNRVVRYRLDADHHAATLDRIILDHLPGAEHHDGGRLRFGPDGMLYVGTGDARVPAIAQSKESLERRLRESTHDFAAQSKKSTAADGRQGPRPVPWTSPRPMPASTPAMLGAETPISTSTSVMPTALKPIPASPRSMSGVVKPIPTSKNRCRHRFFDAGHRKTEP